MNGGFDRMSPSALLSSFNPWYHKLTPVPEDSHVDFSDDEQPKVVRQPFKGLIICATGVPKDVRKQMRDVTERLGGVYSPDLHRGCTHLVVQGTSGQKFRHAIKHGEKWGLKVVTMRWFLVSLQLNARMDEYPYKVIVTDFALEDSDTPRAPPTDDCTDKVLQPRPENCSIAGDVSLDKGPRSAPHVQEPLEDSSTHSDLNLALALVPRPPSLELVTINGESAIAEVKVEEVKLSEDLFKGYCFFIDSEISSKLLEQLRASIDSAGGTVCPQWFIGCKATHLVCEGSTLRKYVGRAANVVTPLWVLRSVERGSLLKSVQFSVDMGRHLATLLGENDDGPGRPVTRGSVQQGDGQPSPSTSSPQQPGVASPSSSPAAVVAAMAAERRRRREQEVQEMKAEIRQRRSKRPGGHATGPKSLSPLQLLESVCWRVTDSPVTARVYCDSDRESSPVAHSNHGLQPSGNRELSPGAHGNYELQPNIGWHSPDEQTVAQWGEGEPEAEWNVEGALVVSANGMCRGGGAGSETRLRGMKESERAEVVFRGPFLTLLFPVDRYGELGPRSRGFFSVKGFTRQQLLERIHTFYQEGMSDEEVSLALHTDSKHADRLRALYVAQPMDDRQLARPLMVRGEFLGSRQNFEGLQRTSHDASGQTYEVILIA